MLSVKFISRYKDEDDYSVYDSDHQTRTRVTQYDDGRWRAAGVDLQPSDAQRQAVEQFIAERDARDEIEIAAFRIRHGLAVR
jgi:hypothetical protein